MLSAAAFTSYHSSDTGCGWRKRQSMHMLPSQEFHHLHVKARSSPPDSMQHCRVFPEHLRPNVRIGLFVEKVAGLK